MTPFIYQYSGKPAGTQTVKTAFVPVDDGRWVPPESGLLISMCYVNVGFTLKSGVPTGQVRLRAVRENPDDQTAYQDYTIGRDNTKDGEFLITHVWFELCEKGRPIHWEVDRSSGFSDLRLNTRYTKWVLIPNKTIARMADNPQMMAEFITAIETMLTEHEALEPVAVG